MRLLLLNKVAKEKLSRRGWISEKFDWTYSHCTRALSFIFSQKRHRLSLFLSNQCRTKYLGHFEEAKKKEDFKEAVVKERRARIGSFAEYSISVGDKTSQHFGVNRMFLAAWIFFLRPTRIYIDIDICNKTDEFVQILKDRINVREFIEAFV